MFEVNPAFTSQIGKMKYMKQMHISIHQAASYVIGRRGMNLKERVPKVLQTYTERKDGEHHWKQWSVLTKAFSVLRSHLFYHVLGQSYPLFNKEICNDGLTQAERDSLQKYVPKSLVRRKSILTSLGMASSVLASPSFCRKSRRIELQNGGCIGARTSQHV
ncbi:hypothetical protein GCM10020331_003890 [Ectobacillus funiculus]